MSENGNSRRRLEQEQLVMSGINQLRKAIFSPLGGLRKGGRVRKSGLYRLHAGERVVPKRRSGRS